MRIYNSALLALTSASWSVILSRWFEGQFRGTTTCCSVTWQQSDWSGYRTKILFSVFIKWHIMDKPNIATSYSGSLISVTQTSNDREVFTPTHATEMKLQFHTPVTRVSYVFSSDSARAHECVLVSVMYGQRKCRVLCLLSTRQHGHRETTRHATH